MDRILFHLVVAPEPLLASELARLVGRDPPLVRRTLSRLEAEGLVAKSRAGDRGPIGTWRWAATRRGEATVKPMLDALEARHAGGR
jgi:DNA-binding IclR family transcriptional regulator